MTGARHQAFLRDLERSQDAVWHVSRWLSRRGLCVRVPPTSFAPRAEDWRDYSDSGDLFIEQRVEVKHLSAQFTGRHDWPFPDFIVCGKGAHDRAEPKPYCYIVLSKDKQTAGIVMGDTDHEWSVSMRKNRLAPSGPPKPFYVTTPDRVTFAKIAP